MAKYIYNQYRLVTTYTKSFKSSAVDAINRTLDKFGEYTLDASTGLFHLTGTISNNNINGFYVSNSSEVSTFIPANISGKYLAEIRDGSNVGVKTLDIYESVPNYSRGAFIAEVVAEENAHPINGREGDYWYIRGEKYAPFPLINVNGLWKEPVEGHLKVNGIWRPIEEAYININGEWKTLI